MKRRWNGKKDDGRSHRRSVELDFASVERAISGALDEMTAEGMIERVPLVLEFDVRAGSPGQRTLDIASWLRNPELPPYRAIAPNEDIQARMESAILGALRRGG